MQRISTGVLVTVVVALVVIATASFARISNLEKKLDTLSQRVERMETPRATPAQ